MASFKRWAYQVASWFGFYEPPRVVVLIHGGGWIGGSPSDWEPLPTMLDDAGYKVRNLDYPVWPEASVADQERWVADRLDDIRDEYPLSEVVVIGGSAGGQLAVRNSDRADRIAWGPGSAIRHEERRLCRAGNGRPSRLPD